MGKHSRRTKPSNRSNKNAGSKKAAAANPIAAIAELNNRYTLSTDVFWQRLEWITTKLPGDTSGRYTLWCIALLLAIETVMSYAIIENVAYTEIDWKAYMQQVGTNTTFEQHCVEQGDTTGFLGGQMNYQELRGCTGPLVYPAGFVYIYSWLYGITDQGADIRLAQHIFYALYIFMLAVVWGLYRKLRLKDDSHAPLWMFAALVISKRIHSIFILRLFNDCWAMTLAYSAILCFVYNRWTVGLAIYSLAVSVKMNVLLFAPGIFLLLLERFGILGTIKRLTVPAVIQVGLAWPFISENWWGYFTRAFPFGKVASGGVGFKYRWSLNMQVMSEEQFLDPKLGLVMLGAHLLTLLLVANFRWFPKHGITGLFTGKKEDNPTEKDAESTRRILDLCFGSNFIGVMFSKSLHYQFYVWYFHTLPFLFWRSRLYKAYGALLAGTATLIALERVWNIYPPRFDASLQLWLLHVSLLFGLYTIPQREPEVKFKV